MEKKLFKELRKAFIIVSVFFFLIFIAIQMLYNVLVSTAWQSESAIHIHMISSFVVFLPI